jgi:toxin ParE1/3/4
VVRLRIAQAAREDLREIRIYGKSAFGAQVARAYLEGLRAVFSLLRDRPEGGAAESDLGEGMRGFAYRSHRVYYRLDAEGVLIVRILHHARDVMRALDQNR